MTTDLEHRLTAALHEGAEGAPVALGLADGARGRARVRRRRRRAVVGAVAVLAVGVPAGTVAWWRAGDHGPRTGQGPASATAEPGFREVSWHGVGVQVPDDWTVGTLTSWCAGGGATTPRVSTPDTVGDAIACAPTSTYGLTFTVAPGPGLDWPVAGQHNDYYPDGAYVGTRDVAGVLVTVATPSAELSRQILGTVVEVSSPAAG